MPIKEQLFSFLSALMKANPILHVIFETTRSRFIQILHHCSISWKIFLVYNNSRVFLVLKPCIFWTIKFPLKKFLRLLSGWVKFHQNPHMKPQVSFSLNFASLFIVRRDNSSLLFLVETLDDLGKINPSKCQILDFQLVMWSFTKFVVW